MLSSYYITALKRVRGILYGVGADGEENAVAWLVKHFRYREIGIPPAMWQQIPQSGKLRHIKFPFPEAENLLEQLSAISKMGISAVEAIAMASAFAVPLLVLSLQGFKSIKNSAIYVFRADYPRDDRYVKQSIYLCGDAVVDMFAHSLEQAISVLSGELDADTVRITRRTLAKEDAKKRFWKLGDGSQGEPFVLYCDLLPPAIKIQIADAKGVPIFAIVPAICVIPTEPH